MNAENLVVADNVVVSMAYVLHLGNGEEIDSADRDNPLEYIHGAGQIIPGLENALNGTKAGDQVDVVLKPSDGYGEVKPEGVAEVDRDNFPPHIKLTKGSPVSVTDRDSGEKKTAYISDIQSETVVLDFNHPLAGEELHFTVEIINIRHPSEDELAHGHVHTAGNGH